MQNLLTKIVQEKHVAVGALAFLEKQVEAVSLLIIPPIKHLIFV